MRGTEIIGNKQEKIIENEETRAEIEEPPEMIRQQATEKVADFKHEGQKELANQTVRVDLAAKEGLEIEIDKQDIAELKALEQEAGSAKEELEKALDTTEMINTSIVDDPEVLIQRENNIAKLKGKLQVALTEHKKHPEEIEELEKQIVESEANYPGDQTLLLQDRLLHPSTQEKLNRVYEKHKDSFFEGEPGQLGKDQNYRFYQERHVKDFQERVNRLFQLTEFGESKEYARLPVNQGIRKISGESYEERFKHPGAIFIDAENKQGVPLTERQKNIIEAHEKGHAVREFSREIAREIKGVLDFTFIPKDRTTYFGKNGDEIIERMSQLKNYFGFKGNEQFTKAHLDHVRSNYIKDTGVDNDMQIFFDAITPEREAYFLEAMNSYPI